MPISDLKTNEELVERGILVIRRRDHNLQIWNYRRATKPGETGYCGYGWGKYKSYNNLDELNQDWDMLIKNGAVEG